MEKRPIITHPRGNTRNPRSIRAWLGANPDLGDDAARRIFLIACEDILGPVDESCVPRVPR